MADIQRIRTQFLFDHDDGPIQFKAGDIFALAESYARSLPPERVKLLGTPTGSESPWGGGTAADVTADSLADTLEGAATTDPASLDRIKNSVSKASGDLGSMLTSGSDGRPALTPPSFRAGLNYASLYDRELLQADIAIQVTPERYADLVVAGDWGPAIAAAVAELAALSGSAHDGPAPVAGSYGLRAAARGAVVLGFGRHYPTNQTITLSKSVGLIAHGSSLTAGPLLPSGAYILDTTNTWNESWNGKISGLTINGANRPVKGARFRRVQGAQVTDLEVGGCQDDGITVVEGYELVMTNPIVWAGQGVAAGKCGFRIEGADSHYTNCVSANYAFGLLLNGAKNNFFTAVHAWGIHTPGYRCRVPFYLTNSSSGNTFTGIYIDTPSKADYTTGTAFTLQADGYINGGVGLYIDATSKDNSFNGGRVLTDDAGLTAAGVPVAAHNFPIVLTSSAGNVRIHDIKIAVSSYWAYSTIAFGAAAPYADFWIRANTQYSGIDRTIAENHTAPPIAHYFIGRRQDYNSASGSFQVAPTVALSAVGLAGNTTITMATLSAELDYLMIEHTIQFYNGSGASATVTWGAGIFAQSATMVIPNAKPASARLYTSNYGQTWYVQFAAVMA